MGQSNGAPARRRCAPTFGKCLGRKSAGRIVAAAPISAAAPILVRAGVLAALVEAGVVAAPGATGVAAPIGSAATGAPVAAAGGAGITAAPIGASGVAVAAVIIVDDGLAETRRHTAAHQPAGIVVAKQRRDALEQQR